MKRVIFMGTPDFAVPVLQSIIEANYEVVLVVTQPDRPKGRKRELTASPVKEAALSYNIPVFQPEKLASEYETLLTYEADIIITAAYGQLLPKALLETPPFGCINVHASLLPELRGGAPIHYAILQGKKETGISIMYMAEKLDAGDIISQAKLPIELTDHVGILHDKLSVLGAELLIETLPAIFEGTNKRVQQNDHEATFAPNITREQEKIDWNNSSEQVYNQIRGLHPWPVAYTNFKGKRMKIWWAERTEKKYVDNQPGEIAEINEDRGFIVVCGDGVGLLMTEVQPAGKKRLPVTDFLRGNPDVVQVGEILE